MISANELIRLNKIESLVISCLRSAQPFVSAWEFDHGDDPQELWQELAILVEEGGFKLFCERCASIMQEYEQHKVAGRIVCPTCERELRHQIPE